jgi:hypothetical protein
MKKYIKESIIKDFISKYYRSPSQNEIIYLYNKVIEENELIEDEGLLANDKEIYCSANEESSAKKYNQFLNKLEIDMNYIHEEMLKHKENQITLFNDRSRALKSFVEEYKKIEQKVNFGILLKQENDVFSHEIIENFYDLSKVDLEKSNIYHLDDDKVTIGVSKITNYNNDLNEMSYAVRHRRGSKILEKTIGSFNNIKAEDNKFFRIESYSDIPDDVVEFIIDIEFTKEKQINEIKYITSAIESNSSIQEDCYYSLNGSDYIHIDKYSAARRLSSDTNVITLNNEDSNFDQKIKAIKIVLRKTAYDKREGDYYAYHFGLDYLGYVDRKYNLNKESVLYCGPYEVLDEYGSPYNYSIARVDKGTCCEIPEETSIDMYLSKDNINFIKAEFNLEHNPIIHFNDNWGNAKSFEIFSLIDLDTENEFITDENSVDLDVNNSQDILNFYIPEENKNKIDLKSLVIKRNILEKRKNTRELITGWVPSSNRRRYKCNFKCSEPEGVIVNFGEQEILLDNKSRSGKVFISYGLHQVEVDKMYFNTNIVSEIDIKSVRALRDKDSFYPYNHRYLIEGFDYKNKFKGEKKYKGFEDQRGCDLKNVNLTTLKNNESLEEYSVVDKDGSLYFVINPFSSFGKSENFDITYRKNISENGNLLFIKAILKSTNSRRTPKIDKIQVRVL